MINKNNKNKYLLVETKKTHKISQILKSHLSRDTPLHIGEEIESHEDCLVVKVIQVIAEPGLEFRLFNSQSSALSLGVGGRGRRRLREV